MDNTSVNASVCSIDKTEENFQPSISNWIHTGEFHKVCKISNDSPFLARFNQCSALPLIQIHIMETQWVAICDSGASRSLLSHTLAGLIWGDAYMNRLKVGPKYHLKDVNNKSLEVKGSLVIDFIINDTQFSHEFLIFESYSHELLLGIDFFRTNSIAIYPNYGLVLEHQKILKLDQEDEPIFPLCLSDDLTLVGQQQQVVTVSLSLQPDDPRADLLKNTFMVAHSEELQPEICFSELQIYFQYVRVTNYLEAQVLLINHTDDIMHYPKGIIIGHAEFIKQVSTVQEVQKDPLASALYTGFQILDDVTINPSESRIGVDISQHEPFNLKELNCYSKDQNHLEWLRRLHLQHKNIIAQDDWNPGTHLGSSIDFALKSNATVCHQRYYKINPAIKEEAERIISVLLERKLIQISKSPWASRVLFVPKNAEEVQTGEGNAIPGQKVEDKRIRKLRMVLDFRYVNLRIKPLNTCWVVPHIGDILNTLFEAKFVSNIDICSGFWHFKLSEKCRKFTAFTFQDVNYECCRLPQGLRISSSAMQYKMRKFILQYCLQGTQVYIDNLMVYASNEADYKLRLEELYNACSKEGYRIKMRKSHHFINQSFILFGFQVNLETHTIQPEKDKVEKIQALPAPNTKKKLKAFIGSVSYFSSLLPKLQYDLTAMHEISGPNAKFFWSEECQLNFVKIKQDLGKFPILYLLRPDRKIEFYTDGAAGHYIAYSLWQHDYELQTLIPIKYASHKLSPSEKNLSQFEVEALGVIYCLMREEALLSYGNSILNTDARSLCFISHFANATSKISRWDLLIRSYDIQINFLPNTNAQIRVTDMLTRGLEKGQLNKKIKKSDIEKFMQWDFSDLPPMQVNDVMALITKLKECYSKFKLPTEVVRRVKESFPIPPSHMSQVRPVLSALNVGWGAKIAQITQDSLQQSESRLEQLSQTGFLSVPTVKWSEIQHSPIEISEILANYLPNCSVDRLILLQTQEPWINNIKAILQTKGVYQSFLMHAGIVMRNYQLVNGIWVKQILLPNEMGYAMTKIFHEQNYFSHFGVQKMKRHLDELFYIKNFEQMATKIIQNCTFCATNKPYGNIKLTPAIKLIISAPRQVLFMDLCTVRSNAELDSFLTILDGFTKYVLYIPIQKDCDAQTIVNHIFKFWVRYFGFPLGLSCDGAKNFTNVLVGQVASLMNCKVCRISAYNSKANLSERWNSMAIAALRIFHQNYGVTDENYDLCLSLVSQMINQTIQAHGFSAFYLQFGNSPRVNNFISLRSLNVIKSIPQYAQELIKVQNVCYVLKERMEQQIEQHDNKTQIPHKYQVGQFVLLRKMHDSSPKHLHKLRQIYYKDVFRVVKRYKTNCLIIPYNRNYFKNRLYNEGKISKQMCSLAKISRLKPVRNPLRFLGLTLSEKLLRQFTDALKLPITDVTVMEFTPKVSPLQQDNDILNKFNPSIQIFDKTLSISKQHKHRLPVNIPSNYSVINDINNIQLQTLRPDLLFFKQKGTKTSSQASEPYDTKYESVTCKLLPRKKVNVYKRSSCSPTQLMGFTQQGKQTTDHTEAIIERDPIEILTDMDCTIGNDSIVQEVPESIPVSRLSTPDRQTVGPSAEEVYIGTGASEGVVSTRATLSAKKAKSKQSSVTHVKLPSGRTLFLQTNPKPVSTITNKKK